MPFMGTVAVDDFYYGTRAAVAGGTTMLSEFISSFNPLRHLPKILHCLVKISRLVASLWTGRQQVVFALLVPSLEQPCNKLDGNICCKVVLTTLIQSRCHKIVTKLTTQGCNNIVIS